MKTELLPQGASQIERSQSLPAIACLTERFLAGLKVVITIFTFTPMAFALAEEPSRNLLLSVLLHLPLGVALVRHYGAISLNGRVARTAPWAPFASGAMTAVYAAGVITSHVAMAIGWSAALEAVTTVIVAPAPSDSPMKQRTTLNSVQIVQTGRPFVGVPTPLGFQGALDG